jgi:hypothetical protein
MPANQTDQDLKSIWRDHAEGRLSDDAAQAAAEAVHARRRGGEGNDTRELRRPPVGLPSRRRRRREKLFGVGRPAKLDRNVKARLMALARALSRRTEKGRAFGRLTGKALAVFEALLWHFHGKAGFCFPGYAKLAERAGCSVSTVGPSIAALEAEGLLTWRHRLRKVWDGARWRVHRTSNLYEFRRDISCKTDFQPRTPNPDFFPSPVSSAAAESESAFESVTANLVPNLSWPSADKA